MSVRKIFTILLLIFIALTVVIVLVARPYYRIVTQKMSVSPFATMLPWASAESIDGKVTFLLLGIGGGAHDGPNLSDSISVLSYDTKTNQLRTLGVPRDVWSEPMQEKVNAAYAIGEAIEVGRGLTLAKAEISSIVGIPIQYAVVVDFGGFKKVIDYLDGVEVDVEVAFTDKEFPIAGRENDECGGDDPDYLCRYETISFKKGLQQMDGETALKFVRSRHASGGEGSDFARSARQQLVVAALRKKVLRFDMLSNPNALEGLYEVMNEVVVRDAPNQQVAYLARTALLSKKDFSQESQALSEDLFEVPPAWQYGRFVLIPKDGNTAAIKSFVRSYFGLEHIVK